LPLAETVLPQTDFDDDLEDNVSDYGSEASDYENAEIDDDLDIEECEAAVRQ